MGQVEIWMKGYLERVWRFDVGGVSVSWVVWLSAGSRGKVGASCANVFYVISS
jgi:hypothetical protein